VPEGHYKVPIGKCDIVRPGEQVTDRHLRHHGVRVRGRRRRSSASTPEIIDVRTDVAARHRSHLSSVKKTGRCVDRA
jgi:pyruvate/2-oxoglutarate/acetoin dehydrogenase E1 component